MKYVGHFYHDYLLFIILLLLLEETQHILAQSFSNLFLHWNHLGALINTLAWLHCPEILKQMA